MRLAFLGTPDFAVPSLVRLHNDGHDVRIVLTQPDRPAGRGRHLQSRPVKEEALRRGIPLFQPEKLDGPALEKIRSLNLEALVVVAYGLILPASLLGLPPRGCINLHASLLPRYRGAAPVAHAILRGETRTGVTTLLMDEGIDTGPMLLQRECPIGPEETAGEVEGRLSEMGAALLAETLKGLEAGTIQPRPQQVDRETYAPKIRPETAKVSWEREAPFICRLVRAMNPRPGATTLVGGQVLKIWRAVPGPPRAGEDREAAAGAVLAAKGFPRVACGGEGSVLLREVQLEGHRRATGEEALRGRWFGQGDCLGGTTEPDAKNSGTASHRV